jgi:hypothetical protein
MAVMRKALTKSLPSMREFERRATEILAELQDKLLPEHASGVIGINVDTGQYVLGRSSEEVWDKFREKWPKSLGYVIGVDGSPVVKFYGR